MAYSMNWKPELDEIEKTTPSTDKSPTKLGPIPGLLPPSRFTPPTTYTPTASKAANAGGSSYSMNWRPKYEVEEADDSNNHSQTGPLGLPNGSSKIAPPSHVSVSSSDHTNISDGQIRISLSKDCPAVQHISSSSFVCAQDGLACTLEYQAGVPSVRIPGRWKLHVHPSNQNLSHHQMTRLAQVIYCCLYAALISNDNEAIHLLKSDMSGLGTSMQNALLWLGLPLDLSLPLSRAVLLQLYAHAEPRLQTRHQPYLVTQSFNGSLRPVAHPLRPPVRPGLSELVYSRLESPSDLYTCIYAEAVPKNNTSLCVVRMSHDEAQRPFDPTTKAGALSIQLGWALEDSALEHLANEVDDYDQVLHLKHLSDDAGWAAVTTYLHSICHYALLKECRGRRVWAVCPGSKSTQSPPWASWKVSESEEKQKSVINILSITQKAFWSSI